jgi:hypothetical protein
MAGAPQRMHHQLGVVLGVINDEDFLQLCHQPLECSGDGRSLMTSQ